MRVEMSERNVESENKHQEEEETGNKIHETNKMDKMIKLENGKRNSSQMENRKHEKLENENENDDAKNTENIQEKMSEKLDNGTEKVYEKPGNEVKEKLKNGNDEKLENGNDEKLENRNEEKLENGNYGKLENENEEKLENRYNGNLENGNNEKLENEKQGTIITENKKGEKLKNEKDEELKNEKGEKLEHERDEKLENEKGEKLEHERDEKLENEKEEKLKNERDEKLENERDEKLENEKDEKLENERDEKLENERDEKLENERDEKLEDDKTEKLEDEKNAKLKTGHEDTGKLANENLKSYMNFESTSKERKISLASERRDSQKLRVTFQTAVAMEERENEGDDDDGDGGGDGGETVLGHGEAREDSGKRFSFSRRQSRLSIFIASKFTFATQALASLVMAHVRLAAGLAFGFSGATLPVLAKDTHPILTPTDVPYFASFVHLGAAVGVFFRQPIIQKLGQRTVLLCSIPLCSLAWLLMFFFSQSWVLLLSSFLLGVSSSFMLPCAMSYTLEVAQDDGRGRHAGIMYLATYSGIIIPVLISSSGITWQNLSLTCFGIASLPIIGILLLPQSPMFLVMKGRITDAQRALIFFRGGHLYPELELGVIMAEAERNLNLRAWDQIKSLASPPYIRTYSLILLVILFLSFSGGYSTTAYLVPILQGTETALDPYLCAVLVAVMGVLGIVVYLCLMERVGRKPLITVGLMVGAVFSLLYGVSSLFIVKGKVSVLNWIPFASINLFSFMVHMSEAVLFTVRKELLPLSLRSIGIQIATFFLHITAYLACYIYPKITENVGYEVNFYIFTVSCVSAAFITGFLLPESKGLHPNLISSRQSSLQSSTPYHYIDQDGKRYSMSEYSKRKRYSSLSISSFMSTEHGTTDLNSPQHTTPQHTAPQHTTPQHTTPQQPTPYTTPKHTTPHHNHEYINPGFYDETTYL